LIRCIEQTLAKITTPKFQPALNLLRKIKDSLLNIQVFSKKLISRSTTEEDVIQCFLDLRTELTTAYFNDYALKHETLFLEHLSLEAERDTGLIAFNKELHELELQTLDSIFIMPFQRIPRYKLLFEDFIKHDAGDTYWNKIGLQEVLTNIIDPLALKMESSLKEENLRAASVTSRDIKLASKEDERKRNSASPKKTESKHGSPTRPKLSKFESENLPKIDYDSLVKADTSKVKNDVDNLATIISPRQKKHDFFPLIFPLSPKERAETKLSKSLDVESISSNSKSSPRVGSSRNKISDDVIDNSLIPSSSKRKMATSTPVQSKEIYFTTRDMKTKSKSSRYFTKFFTLTDKSGKKNSSRELIKAEKPVVCGAWGFITDDDNEINYQYICTIRATFETTRAKIIKERQEFVVLEGVWGLICLEDSPEIVYADVMVHLTP